MIKRTESNKKNNGFAGFLIGISCLLAIVPSLQAQPSRTLLYTLGDSETILDMEFSFLFPDLKYYLITSDTARDSWERVQLSINGIQAGKGEELRLHTKDYSLNRFDRELTAFYYRGDSGEKLYYAGRDYGPYEAVGLIPLLSHSGKQAVYYREKGQYYVVLPGERISGPFGENKPIAVYTSPDYSAELCFSEGDEEESVNIFYRGKQVGKGAYLPDEAIQSPLFNRKGDCFFAIEEPEGGKFSLYLNGKQLAQGTDRLAYKLLENGDYAYVTRYHREERLTIKGREQLKGLEDINDFALSEKGDYIYRHQKDRIDYVVVNGTVVGKHDYLYVYMEHVDGLTYIKRGGPDMRSERRFVDLSRVVMNSRGDYAYTYRENGKFYVSLSGRKEGPYDEAWNPFLADNGNYCYACISEGKFYVVVNGRREGPLDAECQPYMSPAGNYIYCMYKDGGAYININGRTEGPYETVGDDVDDYWTGVYIDDEGNFAYPYTQRQIPCVSMNGTVYQAVYPGSRFHIYPDEKGGFTARYRVRVKNNETNFEQLYLEAGGKPLFIDPHNKTEGRDAETLYSKNRETVLQYRSREPYISINGESVDSGPVVAVGYYPERDLFLWIAQEGKELVLYGFPK